MELWISTGIGLLVGLVGTGIGGLLVCWVKKPGERLPGLLMGLSGGIMVSMVLFDMIPEAAEQCGIWSMILWMALGGLAVFLAHLAIPHSHDVHQGDVAKLAQAKNDPKRMVQMGLLMMGGIALHNLPEGLVIGSGFAGGAKTAEFGMGFSILLLLHNIPEGLALAVPLKLGNVRSTMIFLLALLTGLPIGLGALAGYLIGDISEAFIGCCIAFGAGAMLYITVKELLPEAFSRKHRAGTLMMLGAGILIGWLMVQIV